MIKNVVENIFSQLKIYKKNKSETQKYKKKRMFESLAQITGICEKIHSALITVLGIFYTFLHLNW